MAAIFAASSHGWTPMNYDEANALADKLNADPDENWVYTVHNTGYHAAAYYVKATDENGRSLGRL